MGWRVRCGSEESQATGFLLRRQGSGWAQAGYELLFLSVRFRLFGCQSAVDGVAREVRE